MARLHDSVEEARIGLHEVEVLSIEGHRVRVGPLEALDGTPIVDVKPVLKRD